MFLAFILLIIVAFCGAQFAPTGRLHTDYCSKATTTAVNGIFVVMVFFRHLNTYLQVSAADPLQKQWVTVNGFLGQLIVVSFLFYSGYGIFCSIEKKGTPYVRRMFPHHFLRLFVHFDVCVLLFALVNVLLHRPMSGKDLLLALTTYTISATVTGILQQCCCCIFARWQRFSAFGGTRCLRWCWLRCCALVACLGRSSSTGRVIATTLWLFFRWVCGIGTCSLR